MFITLLARQTRRTMSIIIDFVVIAAIDDDQSQQCGAETTSQTRIIDNNQPRKEAGKKQLQ